MESVPTPETQSNRSQTRSYDVEGNRVNVVWKEFAPTNKKATQDEAVIFLPGWSAGTAKTLENLAQSFANDSGKTALSVVTRAEKVIPDSLYQEAAAIRNMIVDKGLKRIILAGHSEGGTKAADLIHILQLGNPDIEIQGLILLDPVGLYEQKGLVGKFIKDATLNTGTTLVKNILKKPSLIIKGGQVTSDIAANVGRGMLHDNPLGYLSKRLPNQIGEMARRNTHYADVKCPVVLIQGEADIVSSPDRIMLKEERTRYKGFVNEKNQAVQETFFPNSSGVHWLVPKKIGHHGLPHFRSEQISKASLRLLGKYVMPLRHKETPSQA